MKRTAIGVIMTVLFAFYLVTVAHAIDTVRSMSRMSNDYLTLIQKGEWLEAREKLWQLTALFQQQNWRDLDVSVEGIHAISDVLIHGKRSLTRTHPDAHEVEMYAVQIRLSFDALEKREQPLWHNYYRVLKDDVQLLKQAAERGNKEDAVQAVKRLHAHFALIRPALYVSRTPEVIERVQSLITFTEAQAQRVEINRKPLKKAVETWEKLLEPLFFGADEEVLAVGNIPSPPVFVFTWLLAIAIGSVLAYVAWRKARAIYTYRL